jgi:hypothetical protein
LPLQVNVLGHVSLEFAADVLPMDLTHTALELRDAQGEVLGTVLFEAR